MFAFGPQSRRFAIALIGVLFLLAAVFAPFGTIAWTYEYNAVPVTADDPQLAGLLGWVDETAFCSPNSAECELAYRVKDDGPRVVSDATYHAASGFSAGTELIIFRDSDTPFCRTHITYYRNDTMRVSLTQVSNATALELASTPSRDVPRGVQRVVAEGTVRPADPLTGVAYLDETHAIVAHGGSYYRQGAFTYRGTMKGVAEIFRLAALAVGAVLCFHAGRIE